MNLTKKKAIELSIELWTWLAETGDRKRDWPSWIHNGETLSQCFLCEYADRHDGCESSCPYYQKFESCTRFAAPYDSWACAETDEERKKCARLFLEQLKQL